MPAAIFNRVWLQNVRLYIFAQMKVFGGFYPINGQQSHCGPHKHLFVQKNVIRSISFHPFLHSAPFYLPNRPKSYALQWVRHSPKSAPSRWGICNPMMNPSNTWFFVPPSPHTKRYVDRFSCFCNACLHDRASLYFTIGHPFPSKTVPYERSGTLSNTWFFEPSGAHNPDGISIDSAVFCRAQD